MNKYITIEGIDGAGTTSVVEALSGDNITKTHEPSDLWTGKATRRAFEEEGADKYTTFYLFIADRHEHQKRIVEPELENNHVISDRGPDSTRAYQDVAGIPEAEIERALSKLRTPDLTILIDVDPFTTKERIEGEDDFEIDIEFQSKVRNEYLETYYKNRDRIVLVNGYQPLEDVVDEVSTILEEMYDL